LFAFAALYRPHPLGEELIRESDEAKIELDALHEEYCQKRRVLIKKINSPLFSIDDYTGEAYNRELNFLPHRIAILRSELSIILAAEEAQEAEEARKGARGWLKD